MPLILHLPVLERICFETGFEVSSVLNGALYIFSLTFIEPSTSLITVKVSNETHLSVRERRIPSRKPHPDILAPLGPAMKAVEDSIDGLSLLTDEENKPLGFEISGKC